MRQGLNTGLVVVGSIGNDLRMDYTAVGDTTNVAARLLQAAARGRSSSPRRSSVLVGGYFETAALGALSLKGKAEPVSAWLALAPARRAPGSTSRPSAGSRPSSGASASFRSWRIAFARAEAGQGQVVLLVGEPGIGKSRLLHEFQRRIDDRAAWLQGQCLSFGRSMAFHPLVDLLRRAFGIEEHDSSPAIVLKIERAVAALGEDVAAVAPYLRALLSVDPGDPAVATMGPQQRRGETLDALRRLLARAAATRPQVVVIEDLHWVDAATEQFLASLVDSVPASARSSSSRIAPATPSRSAIDPSSRASPRRP